MILDEAEMIRWGNAIGVAARTPLFLLLRGPLGAGKSVLARSIAQGAGVEGAVPSPTFNLVFRYPSSRGVEVVHMDLYRLSDPSELWELGWQELGGQDELVLVEWPDRAEGMLPEHRWEITLGPVAGDREARMVSVSRFGVPQDLPGFPVSVDL
ncbi:MAG: tRNA (adenosine(37)-N6)-threonylcarbamoyltransferase complex ATPase subunit type 1 TsaE [Gemmatimonadetes bacterium]|nr:tRNA (adenosine(37)-N6)-threonylcarbamoyltransferase complex ATPase subunit type 1 TsaE [Gemmatimonadota bacterium]